MMNTHINDLQEQLARVCAERDALREALEFYAQRKHYNDTPLPNNQWKTAEAVFDGGKIARRALGLPVFSLGDS
jgi:hypothetical protein